MKNFNLIKRLFMDSHEKQKPQRFARYAAMLIMLLTLGVGQMWGIGFNKGNVIFRAQGWNNPSYVYLCIGKSDYTSVYQMSRIGSTDLYHVWVNVDNNDNNWWNGCTYFAVIGSSSSVSSGSWGNSSLSSKGNKGYTAAYTSSYDINNSDGCYFFNKANSTVNGGSFTISYTSFGSIQKYNAIQNAKKRDSGSSYSNVSGTFPAPIKLQGEHLTSNGTSGRNTITRTSSSQGTDYSTYSAVVTGTITHSIDEENLSSDYYLEGWGTSTSPSVTTATYEYKITEGTTVYAFFSHLYTLTFLPKGTYGTSTVTASVTDYTDVSSGDKIPTGHSITVTATPATGYEIEGWYSDASCNTSLNNGTNTTYTISSLNANGGVYVKFQKKTYSITLDDNGDYQGNGSATVQRGDASLTVSSHASRTSWNLVGYWTASGDGGSQVTDAAGNLIASVSGFTDGSGNWIKDASVSLYAHWNQINSLSVVAGSNISSVTGSTSPVTLGTKYDITATPVSGYSFSGWTADPAANGAFDNASSASTKVQVNNGSVTVTAAATEIMRSITIVGGTVYGGAATSTTAGVATSAKITANDPAAGKKFTGWSLGAGVSLKGGYALTDQTIEIYSTANATVTATYADRASVKMYFAKPTSLGWSKVYAYAWQSSNGSNYNKAYPGVELENTETINCVVYYTYQYYTEGDGIGGEATGNSAWNKIIFGDNNDDRKTGDLNIADGHYYYKTSTGTGKAAAITSAWGVKTSKDSFAGMNYITHNCATNSGTVDISFTGGNNYNFKLYNEVNDQWWSNSTAMGSSSPVTASMAAAETMYSDDANNMQLNAALTGSYTFTVGSTNASNPTLKVTFPEVYAIVGSFNSWNAETNPLSMAGNTGTANIVLAPSGSNYTLKVVDDGSMYGRNSTTITGTTTVSGMSTSGANINLTADIYPASANPSYGFSYNKSTKALTVTYPSAHTVTYDVGTHAGTTSVTSSISVASGKKILDSQSITFSKGDTKTGYTWKGWYNNTSGSSSALGTDATYTSSSRAANTSVYACYNLVTYTITYNLNGGSNPVSPAPATSFTIESADITLPTPTKTGYTFNGWYENADLSTGGAKTTIPAGSTGNKVYYAKWTPITYTIHFNGNGNTSGSMSDQTGVTYDAATTITANAFVKTGYNFAGWALTSDGPVVRADGAAHGNLASTQGATAQLWAVWTPKQCTVTFDYQLSAEGHGNAGTLSNVTATYDAAMPALTGNMPTAANGYAFMGFFCETGGNGTKYYNSDKSSAHNWDVNTTSTTTLYAYYKKAQVTGITLSPASPVGTEVSVTATATIEPTPTGTTSVCWRVLHSNDSPLDPQPEFSPASAQGPSVSFTSPATSAIYKLEAKFYTGNTCGSGTLLNTYVQSFQVSGTHTVTVNYTCGSDGIKTSTSVTASPLGWSEEITAPEIFGYTFARWDAGTGVTIKNGDSDPVTTSTANPIQIKATYNGSLTAVYTQKNMVYFKDNLGWTDPDDADAHIYVNLLQSDYWNNDRGSGNYNIANRNLQMDRVPGTTDIFYYDYGNKTTSNYISFTKESMGNSGDFYQDAPNVAHVVFPSRSLDDLGTDKATGLGFYAKTPMFVPLATQTPVYKNSNRAAYYNDGYWTKYLPGTGYTLDIYQSDGTTHVKSIAFTSADELMPMKVTTDLEGNHTYKFQLKRDGNNTTDIYYGNSGTMTYSDHGQNTAWEFNNSPFSMCTIVTNAAGDYTFNLSYSPNSGGTNNRLRMAVDYPVATGDYRLIYDDVVQANYKSSAIVPKKNSSTAIVSFFVRKNSTPDLRIQQATVANDGTITWNEYPTSGTPTNQMTDAIKAMIEATSGVYNFNLSMNESGALSVTSAEKYTGNFYIRTDCANSKWDNYRTDPDHLMTYSEYSITHGGYSHYYAHWVDASEAGRKNVKFCIANDYSPSISDTLVRETASGDWANITYYIEEGGDMKRNANVRFMWNQADNTIKRAYIDGAQDDIHSFLELLSADGKIKDAAGSSVLTEVSFSDNENWIYEANIQAQPEAQIKLKSTWGETVGQEIEQYFVGTSSTTEQLIGGSGTDWYNIRLIYDFKTNRLVAAYLPSGDLSGEIDIDADVMFIREAQGDIAQLTFNGAGTVKDIQTAYGVMRFSKWTLNNKSKASGHAPLSPQLSAHQRGMYFISFPFRVKLSEVFGFGTYGTHWVIQYYDGQRRADEGFWAESSGFWTFVWDRKNFTLEPNVGYLLLLDLDLFKESSDVWGPNSRSDQIELFFPSSGIMPDLTGADVEVTLEAHECTIDRSKDASGNPTGLPDTGNPSTSYNRKVFDSHWNIMGVPTYVNTDKVNFANTTWTATRPSFLYTWNMEDNSLSPRSGSSFIYHAMHAYMVQYYGKVTWSAKSGSAYPSSIVARRAYVEKPQQVELRLEIQQNDKMVDQTFVKLSDDEEVSTGYSFDEDMTKILNSGKANIYTFTDNMAVAGNTLPMSDQTTIVPVGVEIATTGEYTFAIPNGTEGIGVVLVDNETGDRTNLAMSDYTVTLAKGTIDGRFVLEISPVAQTPTGIETISDEGLEINGARKVMVDGMLYIVKDGKVFDARGARCK